MENDNPRSSTDHGFLKEDLNPLGFQDFDFEDNHVWCEKCKQLKQVILYSCNSRLKVAYMYDYNVNNKLFFL